ncbi:hypothetical protein XA68_13714 [Ophiocordyceps unilateralis]|uniref:Uncharacterized protein n=1 Tax=Ophiocordyceps unilateralis TaxID=268505 RepID=A0A2A9PBW1_OPHUN|nr:hypothetical protein XA68_13714 [Ophiocordyceps unilateralis]
MIPIPFFLFKNAVCFLVGICQDGHHLISQPVNHSDSEGVQFTQQYATITNYFEDGGPIVVQLTHRSPQLDVEQSLSRDYARAWRGMAVSIEHRYFGASQPNGFKNRDASFEHLTLENVMADVVRVVQHIRFTTPGCLRSEVIAHGDGYWGFVAVALRQNYPDIFFAALAIAPPTRSFFLNPRPQDADQFLYRDHVSRVYHRRSSLGAANIRKSFLFLEDQFLERRDMKRLQSKLNLCTRPHSNDSTHLNQLVEVYANAIIGPAAMVYANTIAVPTALDYAMGWHKYHFGPMNRVVERAASFTDPTSDKKAFHVYGNFLRWVDENWYSRRRNACLDWTGLKVFKQKWSDDLSTKSASYIGCTYFPLCTLNANESGIFLPRTTNCEGLVQNCMEMFEDKAIALTQEEVWTRYKMSPEDLNNSSRILFSVDRSDPMSSLVGGYAPEGINVAWSSCDHVHRIEHDMIARRTQPDFDQWKAEETHVISRWLMSCTRNITWGR